MIWKSPQIEVKKLIIKPATRGKENDISMEKSSNRGEETEKEKSSTRDEEIENKACNKKQRNQKKKSSKQS